MPNPHLCLNSYGYVAFCTKFAVSFIQIHCTYLMEFRCTALQTATQFQTYISNPENYFFDAIANVTRLVIIGHDKYIMGRILHASPVPLKATHVPKLKELELRYCVIQSGSLDFLVAHSSTLEVRRPLVIHTVSICRVSIGEFHLCCLPRDEHLAKTITASATQPMLSESRFVTRSRIRVQRDMEVLVSVLRLWKAPRIAVCHFHTIQWSQNSFFFLLVGS